MLPEILADFCTGGKTLSEIQGRLLHGGVNVARNSGELMHGWQNLARDSGQAFARWGMTSPEFRADFTPVGYDFSEILDLSEGAHGVENSKDGDTYVGEDGEPHRGETEGSEDQYGHLDANSKPDVLAGY